VTSPPGVLRALRRQTGRKTRSHPVGKRQASGRQARGNPAGNGGKPAGKPTVKPAGTRAPQAAPEPRPGSAEVSPRANKLRGELVRISQ